MKQTSCGSFCSSCEKEVIDFRAMDDAELVQYIQDKKFSVGCGRFTKKQLERNILVVEKDKISILKYFKHLALSLILLPLSLWKARAQTNVVKPVTELHEMDLDDIRLKDSLEIKGMVLNEQSDKPMSDIVVYLEEYDIAVKTDAQGYFSIKVLPEVINPNLTLSLMHNIDTYKLNLHNYVQKPFDIVLNWPGYVIVADKLIEHNEASGSCIIRTTVGSTNGWNLATDKVVDIIETFSGVRKVR